MPIKGMTFFFSEVSYEVRYWSGASWFTGARMARRGADSWGQVVSHLEVLKKVLC